MAEQIILAQSQLNPQRLQFVLEKKLLINQGLTKAQ